jgi:hypothetical protein
MYTWSNNQNFPVLATLDNFFASTEWEQHFPLTTVKALPRVVSDHTPLLLDTGLNHQPPSRLFRFEKWWLQHEDFSSLVHRVWNSDCVYTYAMDIWHFKLRFLRKKIKGWSINLEAALKKKKKSLLQEFDILDVFLEKIS